MGTGKRPHEPTAEESGEFTEGIGDWAKDVELQKVNLQEREIALHQRQVELQEQETKLRKREIEVLQVQADSQQRASVLQRWATIASVLIGIGSIAVAVFLGVAQARIAESQMKLASIGLKTSTSEAQSELIVAMSDETKRSQAARALAQFGENAILPLCLTLHAEDNEELLAATTDALVSVYDLAEQEFDLNNDQQTDDGANFEAFKNKFDKALAFALTRPWGKEADHPAILVALRTDRFNALFDEKSNNILYLDGNLPPLLVRHVAAITGSVELGDDEAITTLNVLEKVMKDSRYDSDIRIRVMNGLRTLSRRDDQTRIAVVDGLIELFRASADTSEERQIAQTAIDLMVTILADHPQSSPQIRNQLLNVALNDRLYYAFRAAAINGLAMLRGQDNYDEVKIALQKIAVKKDEEPLVTFAAQDALNPKTVARGE